MHDIPLQKLFDFKMDGKTIDASETLSTAIARMQHGGKNCLLVKMKGDRPVGIISEYDIVIAFARMGSGAKEAKIKDYMTIDVVVARETDTIDDALKLMAVHNVRHVPVLSSDGVIIDFLSMMDLVMKKMSL